MFGSKVSLSEGLPGWGVHKDWGVYVAGEKQGLSTLLLPEETDTKVPRAVPSVWRDRQKVCRAAPYYPISFIYKDKPYEMELNWQLPDINQHEKCLLFQI